MSIIWFLWLCSLITAAQAVTQPVSTVAVLPVDGAGGEILGATIQLKALETEASHIVYGPNLTITDVTPGLYELQVSEKSGLFGLKHVVVDEGYNFFVLKMHAVIELPGYSWLIGEVVAPRSLIDRLWVKAVSLYGGVSPYEPEVVSDSVDQSGRFEIRKGIYGGRFVLMTFHGSDLCDIRMVKVPNSEVEIIVSGIEQCQMTPALQLPPP